MNRLKRETGAARLDLVAHSLDSLICRYYFQRLDGAGSVDDLVTLGTPHGGTVIDYYFAFNTACRETTPTSSFLKDLNRPDSTPGDVHFTAIYTIDDDVALPWWNSTYPDTTVDNRMVDWGIDHRALVDDPTVAGWVNDAVTD